MATMAEAEVPLFLVEQLVIVTSTDEITFKQWRQYLSNNFHRLTRKDSKIYIVGGTHGDPHGQVGPIDERLLQENINQIEWLKREKKKEISEKNISIEHVDLGQYLVDGRVDGRKLAEAMKDPTLIILFCYTDKSEVNDILRAAGLYAAMIIQEDLNTISEGRYVLLDPAQKPVIKTIADTIDLNLFLWGSPGTGKTILLAQVLSMKIANFKQEGKTVTVIVSSYYADSDDDQLMTDFKNK